VVAWSPRRSRWSMDGSQKFQSGGSSGHSLFRFLFSPFQSSCQSSLLNAKIDCFFIAFPQTYLAIACLSPFLASRLPVPCRRHKRRIMEGHTIGSPLRAAKRLAGLK
jgi:hypothetical protein